MVRAQCRRYLSFDSKYVSDFVTKSRNTCANQNKLANTKHSTPTQESTFKTLFSLNNSANPSLCPITLPTSSLLSSSCTTNRPIVSRPAASSAFNRVDSATALSRSVLNCLDAAVYAFFCVTSSRAASNSASHFDPPSRTAFNSILDRVDSATAPSRSAFNYSTSARSCFDSVRLEASLRVAVWMLRARWAQVRGSRWWGLGC